SHDGTTCEGNPREPPAELYGPSIRCEVSGDGQEKWWRCQTRPAASCPMAKMATGIGKSSRTAARLLRAALPRRSPLPVNRRRQRREGWGGLQKGDLVALRKGGSGLPTTILIGGSPADGFQIVGLFADSGDAECYAGDHSLRDWWIAELTSPEAFAESQRRRFRAARGPI